MLWSREAGYGTFVVLPCLLKMIDLRKVEDMILAKY